MYNRSAPHVGQNHIFIFAVSPMFAPKKPLFPFTNVNNGHHHSFTFIKWHVLSFYTDPFTKLLFLCK